MLALAFAAIWLRMLTMPEVHDYIDHLHVLLIPVYAIVTFGLLSAVIVMYRVFTFNDCPEANQELMKQIEESKSDLKKKGFVFNH